MEKTQILFEKSFHRKFEYLCDTKFSTVLGACFGKSSTVNDPFVVLNICQILPECRMYEWNNLDLHFCPERIHNSHPFPCPWTFSTLYILNWYDAEIMARGIFWCDAEISNVNGISNGSAIRYLWQRIFTASFGNRSGLMSPYAVSDVCKKNNYLRRNIIWL